MTYTCKKCGKYYTNKKSYMVCCKKTETNHNLGQYFTTNIILQQKIFEFILNNPKKILEPSIGQGNLIKFIHDKNDKIKFDMYEIDESIKLLEPIKKNKVIYCDFMKVLINK